MAGSPENSPEDSPGDRRIASILPGVVADEVDKAVGILKRDSGATATAFHREASDLFARLVQAVDRGAQVEITILEQGRERPTHLIQPLLLELHQHRTRRARKPGQ